MRAGAFLLSSSSNKTADLNCTVLRALVKLMQQDMLQMSKADKARMKKDKAKSFNNAGAAKSASKNAKRWN